MVSQVRESGPGAPAHLWAGQILGPGPPARDWISALPRTQACTAGPATHSKAALRGAARCCNQPKWKTKIITEKKAIRYAITQPNRFHSRFDLGHHAQNAYPASQRIRNHDQHLEPGRPRWIGDNSDHARRPRLWRLARARPLRRAACGEKSAREGHRIVDVNRGLNLQTSAPYFSLKNWLRHPGSSLSRPV